MARRFDNLMALLGARRRSPWGPAMIGAAVGLLVGAAAALLLAPSSGEELRAELAEKLARTKERLAKHNGSGQVAHDETGG